MMERTRKLSFVTLMMAFIVLLVCTQIALVLLLLRRNTLITLFTANKTQLLIMLTLTTTVNHIITLPKQLTLKSLLLMKRL